MGPTTVCRCYRACLRHISLELCSTSTRYIYKHSMLFLLGTTWTRSFCGELAVTLTLKRRPTPRHFLRSPVHLRQLCHVNANVLPDNVTTPVEVLWENFIPGYSWHGKIRLASPLWRIAKIRNDRSLIFGDDEKFWSVLWKCFYGESMLFFFFFFSLQINKRKMGQDPNGWIITDVVSIFATTRGIISKRFYGRWSLLFLFFLNTDKVDPNGEKMDYRTRL